MRILTSLLLISLLLPDISNAQVFKQTVRGKITDADSKSPLPGANVVIKYQDSILGSVSDADGKFRIANIPVGRHSIKITFIGYEEMMMSNIIVTSGKEVVLNIELQEKVYASEVVEIIAEKDKTRSNNDLVTVSARNFRSEETERYAGSRGDPSKMVSNYAGVSTGNDARNDIIVRGNSPLGVLWRLEGVDIPNPNHFSSQGSTGGPLSILNNNQLGNSDFLTGAFPAEYGNKMASVFDLKLRNGNNEKFEGLGQFGMNGLELGVEGPISKKAGSSYLFNYRYSTLELFTLMGISFGVSANPKYQDCSFKLNFPTEKAGTLSLWGIGGISEIKILDSEQDTTDWSFTNSGEDLIFGSQMGAGGLTHSYFFTNNLSGKLSLSAAGNLFKINIDTLSSIKEPYNVFNNNSLDGQYNANYTLTNKFNAHHLVKTGIFFQGMMFNYQAKYWRESHNRYYYQFNQKDNSSLIQGFMHWQYKVTNNMTMNSGLHYQNFTLNSSQALEPRAGFRWQFSQKQSVNLGYGLHSQTQPMVYYFLKTFDNTSGRTIQTNRDLGLSKSHHYIAGYDWNLKEDFRFKFETYYQDLYNIPILKSTPNSFSLINVGTELEGLPLVDSLSNGGTGNNYGVEITLEKFFSRHYYFLSTVSLYKAKYKGSDNIERNSAYSGGYVYNLLGGVEYPIGKGNWQWSCDVKGTFAGGNRYTPIDVNASLAEHRTVYVYEEAFSKKFKDYQRVDVKLAIKVNQKRITQSIFINIDNVLNRKNVLRQVFDPETGQVTSEYQLGIFPFGGYRIYF